MLKRILLISVSLAMASYLPNSAIAASFSSARASSVSSSRSVSSSPSRSFTAVRSTSTVARTSYKPVSAKTTAVKSKKLKKNATSVASNHSSFDYYAFDDCVPYQSASGNGWKCLDND